MAKIPYKKVPGKIVASAALLALLGGAAPLVMNKIANSEGYVPQAYKDPVGIWTKCFGDTRNVTPGAKYSFDQCVQSLNSQILAHGKPILKCVPRLAQQPDKVKAAMVSMAYNIGVNGFCASSVARYANRGEWENACRRISQIYKTAKGKELPGLVKRRQQESELCLEGLREAWQ
ncbi:MAG: lysozyme [Desulfovibrio sp.]|jgi:lysozyme|nr:lysozyme [Desulfovibrio sp.]